MKIKQQGLALVASAALLAMAMALLVFGINEDIKRMLIQSSNGDQSRVALAGEEIRDWYERNAWNIDQTDGIPDISGINPYNTAGVIIKASKRLEKNGIKYHVIAAWVPMTGATGTGLNADTGEFSVGTLVNGDKANVYHLLVSGYEIQSDKLRATRKNMQRIASGIEAWARARQQHDPDGIANRNWMRRADCSKDNGEIPCYDTLTQIDHTDIPVITGVSPIDSISGWARPIYAENVQPATGPFRVTLQAETPWGADFILEALQQ